MATQRTIERQPDKLDYLSPTQFKFNIHQLPKVEFFTVSASIPLLSTTYTSPVEKLTTLFICIIGLWFRVIIELLGAPKEHVEKSAELVAERISKLQDTTLVSENTYEAEEKQNGLLIKV